MRGKVVLIYIPLKVYRITPAHAGKSLNCQGAGSQGVDHPRTCGEKLKLPRSRLAGGGSPPHMRGKAKRYTRKLNILLDHPRTCGEKLK